MPIHSISREIVDTILSGLDSNIDRESIRALSRVSTSFRPHCLRILFSLLSFHPSSSPHVPTTCRAFYNLVQSTPHIPPLVQTLNIREGGRDHLWIPTEPTFPDVMRALVNVTAISMVFVRFPALPAASRLAITNHRFTRIHLDSVHFGSDSEFRELLRHSSDSLEVLDLGNITFEFGTQSHDEPMRGQPIEECRLTMLMLDVQSEGDAAVLNILFGPRPPIRMNMVERLWLTEVCISSDAVVEGLDKLWSSLVVSDGGMLGAISVGDCHGLEESLRAVTLNGVSEISFLVATSRSDVFSPSLQWWSNNFKRAAVTAGWEPDGIFITLRLETGSSVALVSLFDNESFDAWARIDTSLCAAGLISTPAVEVRIILDAEHDSMPDFLFMQSWVRRQLPMLHYGQFLRVRQVSGDL